MKPTSYNMDYSQISKDLTTSLTTTVKKQNGIYFTPPSCVHKNIKILEKILALDPTSTLRVLEPSCGSCEYVTALNTSFPELFITGIENNETIYQSIQKLNNDKITLKNIDYLNQFDESEKFDLIIGNPPYFVMKRKEVDKKYYNYFDGRPNIFVLFIIKSLNTLKDEGILSFILPRSFLNCLYYDKTRKHIRDHCEILMIMPCDDDKYIETQQDTVLLILRKTGKSTKTIRCNNRKLILEKNDYTIFAEQDNIIKFKNFYANSTTLKELGFKVSVGNVVWNQCKKILTDDTSKTRLIYSSDIENSTFIPKKYSNADKKNFIDKKGIRRPMIVINRGYGVGEYKFNYCLINDTTEYLVENHLICIEHTNHAGLPPDELIKAYEKILVSLDDQRTVDFINEYFGNNAINTVELNEILPIY